MVLSKEMTAFCFQVLFECLSLSHADEDNFAEELAACTPGVLVLDLNKEQEHVWVIALSDISTKNYIFPFHWLCTAASICCVPERVKTAQPMCVSQVRSTPQGLFISCEQ